MLSAKASRFGDLPGAAAALWPDAVAVSYYDRNLTFRQLSDEIDRTARALLARGIGKGDTVGMWVTNRADFILAFYAGHRIGAVVAPMNTRYREHDLAYVVKMAEVKLLFVVERSGPVEYLEILKAVLPGFDGQEFRGAAGFAFLKDVVVMADAPSDAATSWERFLADGERVSAEAFGKAVAAVQPTDPALIIFTSGTTGNPKGVLHDHSFLRNIRERHEAWPLRAGDTVLNYLPMFHLFSMAEMVFGALCMGVRQVVMDSWEPEEVVRLIERERVAGIHGFETHYADIMRAQAKVRADLSSLKFGGFPAGMESSNAIALRAEKELCQVASGMGMSESGCYICVATLADSVEQRCTTSGKPMDGIECRIVDPVTGVEQPAGVEGEILFRGYTVMKGYFRNPEATAQAIDADGWLHSGDRGYVRPDGFLQFLGRYKEMLKVGGENVSPAALELELSALVPSIEQVAVVGIPDERLAEVAVAYVVPKPGQTCTLADVQARCKGKIASFKIPRHVLVVDSLPMTASGKVQRVMLRDRATRELVTGAARKAG
jgi:fatty-acyl-CoA synthase